jgi:NDP-sugar pyrophosphorylase family protein
MFCARAFFQLLSEEFSPFFSLDLDAWLLLDKLDLFLQKRDLISIGKGTVVAESAVLEGPCFIGENCEIRPHAYIRKGSVIGNNCVIGHGTEINRSLILDGAKLAHFNYVGDTIVGQGVNLGAGSKCANLRLDEKEIAIFCEGTKILTGRKKFGSIIGHGASVGCNAVLNPGTILFPGASVAPCTSVKGVIQ